MRTVTDEFWAGAAAELAQLPGVVTRLLDRHVADGGGRCRECRSSTSAGPAWPCNLARLAQRAAARPGGRPA